MADASAVLVEIQAAILGLVAVGVAGLCYFGLNRPTVYASFPRAADRGFRSIFWPRPVQEVVWEGYQQITKPTAKPFTVRWWARDYLILPPKYLPSLRDAGWSHLSFFKNISDAFFLHASVGDLYDRDTMVQVVQKGLNPRLPQLTSILEEEIEYALEAELEKQTGNDSVPAQSFFTALVHRSASRILVGSELCRNEEFIRMSTDFVMSIFITGLIIVKLPLGPLREWLAYPLARWHRSKLARCNEMLLPVVRRRIEERSHADPRDERNDAIEWSLMLSGDPASIDARDLSTEIMHNLWAGTSAPGGLVTDIIFQLLLEPRYREPLIEEARAALGSEGHWTEKALGRLPLLDSFIREINRLYPTGSITCSRTVLQRPYTFPDGLTLPVGTRFGFPTKAMLNDRELAFDGFRFAKHANASRSDEGNVAGGQAGSATAMSTTNLAWGYGTHVCPGRFFGVRLIKVVVVTLLLRCEIQWDGQVDTRPVPTMIEGQFIPNLTQKIKIQRKVI